MKWKEIRRRFPTTLICVITVVILIAIELLVRGMFIVSGRHATWGYPTSDVDYRPYIGFANKQGNNRYQYGFRLDSNDKRQRDLNIKEEFEFRIFILGGSTVDGRKLSNIDDTIPARLERMLQKQMPPGIRYSVVNGGKGAYISVQSVLQHAFYVKYSFEPDFVIHFDGSNDSIGDPPYWPKGLYRGVHDNIHHQLEDIYFQVNNLLSFRGLLDNLLRKLTDYSGIIYLVHKTINDPQSWNRWYRGQAVVKDDNKELNVWIKKHVNRYIYNVKLALSLADQETGVAYFFQPSLLPYMNNVLTNTEKKYLVDGLNSKVSFHGYDRRKAKQLFYERVRVDLKDLTVSNNNQYSIVRDLSNLFDSKPSDKDYFSDHVHYSSLGRSIVVDRIMEQIQPRIKLQLESSGKFKACI